MDRFTALTDDVLFHILWFSGTDDLLKLALSCRRFGAKTDNCVVDTLSLVEEVARKRIEGTMNDKDADVLLQRASSFGLSARRGNESWLAVDYRLGRLLAQCDPENYVLIVEAHGGRSSDGWNVNDNPAFRQKIFCYALKGESVEKFFRSGTISVSLSNPRPWNDTNNIVGESRSGIPHIGIFVLKSRISLLRKGDGKVIELHTCSQSGYFYLPTANENAHITSHGQKYNDSCVYTPDLFRLCFEGELTDAEDNEEDNELELEFELIHENEDNPTSQTSLFLSLDFALM